MNRVIVRQLIDTMLNMSGDDVFVECNYYYFSRALKTQVEGTYMEEGLDNLLTAYRNSHAGYRIIIANKLLNKLEGGWVL